ncbi:MAG: DUF4157 domain-containing protein [Myxococcota bacterium]
MQSTTPKLPRSTTLIQLRAGADAGAATDDVHAAAAHGIASGGGPLPFAAQLQAGFGRHDLSNVQAHTGGAAERASAAMGAEAYASGRHVVFGRTPDLHTAAHEAAHVIQQRAGVSLKSGVGQVGDAYERHADQVADAVVAGRSAEGLLDAYAPGGGGASGGPVQLTSAEQPVQRYKGPNSGKGFPEGRGGKMLAAEWVAEVNKKKIGAYATLLQAGLALGATSTGLIKKSNEDDAHEDTWLALSKDVSASSKEFLGLASAVAELKAEEWVEPIEAAGKGFEVATGALSVLEAAQAIANTEALDAFREDPNEATAEAWADGVTSAFETCGGVIDLIPMPMSFIREYFTGLFRAPKAYVKAFLGIMKKRYAAIDDEAEVRGDSHFDVFEGPYTGLMVQANVHDHEGLYAWLVAHKTIRGKALARIAPRLQKDLVITEIGKDASLSQTTKDRYIAFVGAQ